MQAADSGGERSRATTSQPNPNAASARSFSKDYKPACYSRPNLPTQQLSIRTSEPAALDWEHGENQQRSQHWLTWWRLVDARCTEEYPNSTLLLLLTKITLLFVTCNLLKTTLRIAFLVQNNQFWNGSVYRFDHFHFKMQLFAHLVCISRIHFIWYRPTYF